MKASISVAFALCIALGPLGGCKHRAVTASGLEKVTLTLDWRPEPEFGGFYAAKLNKSFQNHGLDVDLRSGGAGAPMWQLVANGNTEFATTAADQVIVARARGADIVALFAVYQTSPQGIMVHAARGFTSIGDVFTHPGTLAAENNPWLTYCMHKFSPVTVTITSQGGGVPVFVSKPDFSMQCFITSEPLESRKLGSDPQTFLIADAGYNPYTTVLIARGDVVRNKPARIQAMVAACGEGWRAYLDDPAPANQAMHQLNPNMDSSTFTAAAQAQKPLIETNESRQFGLGSMTAQRWSELGKQLVDLKVIETAPRGAECFAEPSAAK